MTTRKKLKSALEAMLFTWGEPLPARQAAEVLDIKERQAVEYLRELMEEYEQEARGIRIREINKSFQFVTSAEEADYVERLCTPVKAKRLSQSALEVLAIIAYRQPVTKGEIEAVRGIKCDRSIEGLQKKGLIEERGRSQALGRPILYGTTDEFLHHFGLSSIKELPPIDDLEGAITDPEIQLPEGSEADPAQISLVI